VKKTMTLLLVLVSVIVVSGCDQETARSPDSTITPEEIMSDYDFSLTREEVLDKYGDYFKSKVGINNQEIWLYNYKRYEDYEEKDLEDEIDYEGLKEGNLVAQLYIFWDQSGEEINNYSLYYLLDDEVAHTVHFATGEQKTEMVILE
jgi:hypothetical protein